MTKNIIIFSLIITLVALFYFNRKQRETSINLNSAITALSDTLHTYKTENGALGASISVVEGDRKSLISLLSISSKNNKVYKQLIDSLKKNPNIQTISVVNSVTKTEYVSTIDTLLVGIKFTKNIKDEWVDETISVDSGKLSRILLYRDEYVITNSLKDNKGLFTGKTLTTYVSPKNPNTQVTGITSVSTVVNKRKMRIGTFIGPSLSIDKNYNIIPTISVGIGFTF